MVAALTDTPLATQGVQPKPTAQQADQAGKSRGLFGEDGFSFWDLLDIVNPLQHIPIVSTIYRAVTGDTIDPGARIAGGTLFGGPIGMVVSLVSAMVEEDTGKDPGEHALALLGIGDEPAGEPATAMAEAPPPPQPDRVPPELLAAVQPPPRQELKLSVKPADADGRGGNEPSRRPAAPDLAQSMMAAQGVTQAQADEALAAMAVRARGLQPGARSIAAPAAPPQTVDGRTWFPAFPQGGGGAPVRGIGAQPVSSQNAVAKFGVARGASDQGAGHRAGSNAQAEWAERAAAAYQKYATMQQQRERQRAVDASY